MSLIDNMYKICNNGDYMTENLDNLPEGISIFTLPITASFNNTINVENIFSYYPLSEHNIVTIKSTAGIRTLYVTENMIKSEDETDFMNQITVVMNIFTDETKTVTKFVNIKLFKNGSIQVSGLKSIFQCNYTINKLFNLLKGEFYIYTKPDKDKGRKFYEHSCKKRAITFLTDYENMWLYQPTISTINVTYKYATKINQEQFFLKMKELQLHKIIVADVIILLQTDINSPVSMWLNSIVDKKRYLTIALFESGSISIMACKCREDILYAFKFIIDILTEYGEYVSKKDIVKVVHHNDEIISHVDLEALEEVKHMY